MTPNRKKQLNDINNRLLNVSDEFDKLFAATVNKRMPIERAQVMDNAAFGLMLAKSALRGMLDILHDEDLSTDEKAKSSDKERAKVQRGSRMGNR